MFASLPEKFARIISEAHGVEGKRWLVRLPEIVERIENEWNLSVFAPFPNLSYHFVAPCVCAEGSEAVLKIGFPENDSPMFNEAEILRLYNGNGAVKFLRLDAERFALLLEKLDAGKTLKDFYKNDDRAAVQTAIEILRKIKRKPPDRHNFVRLEDWFFGFKKAKKTIFPAEKLNKADGFYHELKGAEKHLLHGDFHHENLLSATRESFLAIDPKGIVGEIGYEIAVFLNNHHWWLESELDLSAKLNDAVRQFSEAFNITPEDLRKWAYAQMVLSAWWTFEENGENWQSDLALAEIWEV